MASPSLGVDDSLNPLLAHMRSLGQDVESDSINTWDDSWLQQKMDEHRKIVEFQKRELKHTKIWDAWTSESKNWEVGKMYGFQSVSYTHLRAHETLR